MKRVIFLHPDLGIGGAERLVVDAAVALKSRGHNVKIVTNQYDRNHAFVETTSLDICVVGSWIPRTLFGGCAAFCAYIRMIYAALWICLTDKDVDAIIVDQVSACLPWIKCLSSARLIFYCHFPDLLLTQRRTVFKKLYRSLIDKWEEWSMNWADVICVNSKFTRSIVEATFPSLTGSNLNVIYPSLNMEAFDSASEGELDLPAASFLFTSLNRFERKKNVKLALEAFGALKNILTTNVFKECHLVIAGGYDHLNTENIEYFNELVEHTSSLGLNANQITFIKSPTDAEKISLLRKSTTILYTPDKEHFGIVPVEAMYLKLPVIAVNSGGPMETVLHGSTGFLVEQSAESFAIAMKSFIDDPTLRKKMGEKGNSRVKELFGFQSFVDNFDRLIK